MLNPGRMIADLTARRQSASFIAACPGAGAGEARLMQGLVGWALGRIARSDALYHDLDHSVAVLETARLLLLGQAAMGKPAAPGDWLHLVAAAALHDIGYVHGVCAEDRPGIAALDCSGRSLSLAKGATDAALAPYHVDRACLMIGERLTQVPGLDPDRLCRAIGATRFPPPSAAEDTGTDGEGQMLRAADLIGQFADPGYPRKVGRLFIEFDETGEASRLGYANPCAIWSGFPVFYDTVIAPQIAFVLPLLGATAEGRALAASLARNRRIAGLRPGQHRGD